MIFPNFQNCACCEKYLKENKHKSLHLARKYARIVALVHYLFLKAQKVQFNVRFSEQIIISEHISVPNGGYCLSIQKKASAIAKATFNIILYPIYTSATNERA